MPSVIDVTLTVGQPSYVTSRYPGMVRIQYPLIPPQPAGFEVNSTNFLVPLIHFDLPPDTRDIFGILIQDKRTLIAHKVTLVSDTVGDNRDMKISGQDAKGNYIEEVVMLNGTTAVTSVKTYNWILWVTSFYGTVLNEVPTPPTDGTSTVFTVANQPVTGSVQVYIDSVAAVLGIDYTTTGNQVTFVNPPVNGSQIQISYIYELFPNANVRISAPGTIGVLAAGALQWLSNPILYRYEDLSFGGSNSDPALTFAYNNPTGATTHEFLVYFYNLLDELSLPLDINQPNLFTPPKTVIDCVDVRGSYHGLPGAIGDGVTDDTAAVQSALDQAHENYLAIQAALAANNPAPALPTKVCITSGMVCLVKGALWRSAQGIAWPNNPRTGVPWDAILFVRSGVTVQLDGEVLIGHDPLQVNPFTCGFAFYDNSVSDKHVTGASIQGIGTIDGQSGLYPFTTGSLGFGIGIFAIVAQGCGFSADGITIQNCFGEGILTVDALNPHLAYPQEASLGVPVLPVPTGPVEISVSMNDLTIINCSKAVNQVQNDAFASGGVYVYCYGASLTNIDITQCTCRTPMFVAGTDITVHNCFINGNPASVMLWVDRVLRCKILNNTVTGTQASNAPFALGGAVGISTRASKVQQPTTLIDWIDTLQIDGNVVGNVSEGIQLQSGGLLTAGTQWSRITIAHNTLQYCTQYGIVFNPFSRFAGQFQNVVVGPNNYNNPNAACQLLLPDGCNLIAGAQGYVGFSVNEPGLFTQVLTNGFLRNYGPITNTDTAGITGAINGANKVFTLAQVPNPPSSLLLYVTSVVTVPPNAGALFQVQGVQYTLSGATITFATAPPSGAKIVASYNF
jgi:hypothetical protein